MRRRPVDYVCVECDARAVQRMGRCPGCGSWNSMVPIDAKPKGAGVGPVSPNDGTQLVPLSDAPRDDVPRLTTGIGEFDRVTGGGLVSGGVVLLGGDPGIGKSTLLLQVLERLSLDGRPAAYIAAEESLRQVKLRADRMGLSGENVLVLNDSDLPHALAQVQEAGVCCVGLDSIQAVKCPEVESAPGSIQQIRECTSLAVGIAKASGLSTVITGHVTKEGSLAGPKSLEHMVDTVLYFEGEYGQAYRIVRAVKNRFGSTDEIGIFEMRDSGLDEVSNPSALCLSERPEPVPGCAVVGAVQGTRPLLVEAQALVASSQYGSPRRVVSGVDGNRLALTLAVLERRAGLDLSARDVFVSAAGGLKLVEPAADLGIAVAAASAASGRPVPTGWCLVGEVGLTGEVRPVSHLRQRVAEAGRMGYSRALVPAQNLESFGLPKDLVIEVVPVQSVTDAIALCLGRDAIRAGAGTTATMHRGDARQ